MPQSRQLAAIMFTDIVGYTVLMGNDEDKAFDLLNKNRQLQKPIIEKYGGKWIKELGGGVMASFATATDAVQCSISIQQACTTIPDLKLRIGIHLGDVVFENSDVFGDGVNIASRFQRRCLEYPWFESDPFFDCQGNTHNLKGCVKRFTKNERFKADFLRL